MENDTQEATSLEGRRFWRGARGHLARNCLRKAAKKARHVCESMERANAEQKPRRAYGSRRRPREAKRTR